MATRELRNINWLLVEKVFSLPVQFLISILLARYFGAGLMGEYSFLISLLYLVSPLSQMGLNALLVREFISSREDEDEILGAALVGKVIGGVVSLALLVLFIVFYDDSKLLLLVVLGGAQIFSAFTLLDFWFQARVEVRFSVFSRLLPLFVTSALRIWMVVAGASLEMFIYVYALELFLIGLCYILFYRKRGGRLKTWTYKQERLRGLLSQSWLLILSGFAAALYLRIDIVMLKHWSGAEVAGIYFVASRVSEVWYFIPTAIVTSFFPLLIMNRASNPEMYKQDLQTLADFLFVVALLVVIPVFLLSDFLILTLFGIEYTAAAPVLKIHILASTFIFLRALLSKWIIAENLLKFSLITQVTGAAVNIVLNLLWIPIYGAEGAAWATVISYAFASYFALFLHTQSRPVALIFSRSVLAPLRWRKLLNSIVAR